MTMDNSRFKDDIPNLYRICTGFSIATFVYILYSTIHVDLCNLWKPLSGAERGWQSSETRAFLQLQVQHAAWVSLRLHLESPWAWCDICALENSGLPGGMLIFTLTWACFMLRRKSGTKPRLGPFERRCPNWLSNRSIAWSHLYPTCILYFCCFTATPFSCEQPGQAARLLRTII